MLIKGKNINLRLAEVTDATFIFELRKNSTKTKYLSQVNGDIANQEQWLREYKKREVEKIEYYFIIESKGNVSLGLVRIYDLQKDSFSWGSWLIKEDAPKSTAIESALQVYEFGFYFLGFKNVHFEVRKGNEKVIAFHKRFGAKTVSENDIEYFFTFSRNDYEVTKEKYKRYLK